MGLLVISFYNPRRTTGHDTVVGYILRDHCIGTDYTMLANQDIAHYHYIPANPRTVTYIYIRSATDGNKVNALLHDGAGYIPIFMIKVGDVHVRTREHLLANSDVAFAVHSGGLSDVCAISNLYFPILSDYNQKAISDANIFAYA